MKIEELVLKTKANFGEIKGNENFDPAIIMVFAELIIEAIEAFRQYCAENDPSTALDMAQSPSRLSKLFMRRKIRAKIGFGGYRKHGDDILSALVATANDMTESDMKEAYEQA